MINEQLNLPNLEKWKSINIDFSVFDYVYRLKHDHNLPSDFLNSIIRVFWPSLVKVDGMIFLADRFSRQKYDQLVLKGMSFGEIERWLNLINIDSYFNEEDNAELIEDFGAFIAGMWEIKLSKESTNKKYSVDIIKDSGEFYVTFYQKLT